jgi:hypothetical protein
MSLLRTLVFFFLILTPLSWSLPHFKNPYKANQNQYTFLFSEFLTQTQPKKSQTWNVPQDSLFLRLLISQKLKKHNNDTLIPITLMLLDSNRKKIAFESLKNDTVHLVLLRENRLPLRLQLPKSKVISAIDTAGFELPISKDDEFSDWPEMNESSEDEAAYFEIITETPGASVMIDQAHTPYTTPVKLKNLPSGEHTFEVYWKVEQNLWSDQKRIIIDENTQLTWHANLKKGLAGLNILSRPSSAEIFFLDKNPFQSVAPQIKTPWISPPLEPGWHRIRLEKKPSLFSTEHLSLDTSIYLDGFQAKEMLLELKSSNIHLKPKNYASFWAYSALMSAGAGFLLDLSAKEHSSRALELKQKAQRALIYGNAYKQTIYEQNQEVKKQNQFFKYRDRAYLSAIGLATVAIASYFNPFSFRF